MNNLNSLLSKPFTSEKRKKCLSFPLRIQKLEETNSHAMGHGSLAWPSQPTGWNKVQGSGTVILSSDFVSFTSQRQILVKISNFWVDPGNFGQDFRRVRQIHLDLKDWSHDLLFQKKKKWCNQGEEKNVYVPIGSEKNYFNRKSTFSYN